MSKDIQVVFPGGKMVTAHCGVHTIQTDQSIKNGGTGAFPEPFELFLSALATCAGVYALEFCTTRAISTEGMALSFNANVNPEVKLYDYIEITLTVPKDFPNKYDEAIKKAMELCAVKRHLHPSVKVYSTIVHLGA